MIGRRSLGIPLFWPKHLWIIPDLPARVIERLDGLLWGKQVATVEMLADTTITGPLKPSMFIRCTEQRENYYRIHFWHRN
jgi:hypothetical protein